VFSEIVTHERPHLDEIVAIWLLRRFGEQRFPGISQARITYAASSRRGADAPDAQALEAQGILLLGVGGGRFDEHPTLDNGRKAEECAATLVAGELGVLDDPSMQKILRFVKSRDLEGNSTPFDLSYMVKLLHRRSPNDPDKVIDWTIAGIEAKYEEQRDFFTVARNEFETKAKVEEVQVGSRRVRIAAIESDSESVSKYARSEYGGRAGIVIQKRSSGNVSILVNKQMGLDMRDVVRMIRLAEQQAKGKFETTDSDKLTAEGNVRGVEEWFYHERGQMLLNGSLTATGVPPTRLDLERIREIVRTGIVPGALRKLCASTGKCTGEICDWYQWNLDRCRALRQGTGTKYE
jgi:hypothetical protein